MIYLENTTQSQQVYIPRQIIQTATTREINNITSGDVINIVDEKLEPYYTSAETDTQIENAVAAESARCEETYAKISDIPDVSDFVTSADVKTQIEDYHYITSGDLPDVSEFITSGQAQEQINQSLSGYVTEQWVEDKHYLTEHQSLSAYSTTEQIEEMIANESARTEETYAKISDVPDLDNYYTSAETDTAIENAIAAEVERANSTYATPSDIPDVSEFITSADLASYALSADVDTLVEDTIAAESARCEETYAKPDDVSSAVNELALGLAYLGVVNDVSESNGTVTITKTGLVSGEITTGLTDSFNLPDVSNFVTSADVETQITNKNYITSADAKTQIEAYNYVNSGDVETQLGGYDEYAHQVFAQISDIPDVSNFVTSADVETQITGNLSAYTPTSGFATINGSGITDGGNLVIQGGGSSYTAGDGIDITNDVISVTGRQETLVSGTNIKTINNQSLLGSGNIDIQGGGGNANIIELTQQEYDALTAYTEDALYVITDAEEVDLNDYATSADLATKVDKINVSASSTGYNFPKWNTQGQITGSTTVYSKSMSINGSSKYLFSTFNESMPTIYAPTTAGDSGQILQSNGSGAPSWSSFKFWYGSQLDYDLIYPKDPNCIYFVQ